MVCAPLMIMVYDRLDHFKSLISSLLANPLADQTDLYVISDAAYKDEHQKKITAVRNYAHTISGFKSFTLIENPTNMGAYDSYTYLMSLIFEKHENLIFFEDDNIVSPNYLEFMNHALNKYEHESRVAYVCGYNFPIEIPKDYAYDIYFYRSVCAWGYGLWKHKFLNVNALSKDEMRKDKKTIQKIKNNSSQLYHILMSDIYSTRFLNDARIGYLMAKNDLVSVFPCFSLVKNTGHDGSGLNCGINDFYQTQTKDDNFIPKRFPDEIFIDGGIKNEMYRYTSMNFKTRLKAGLKLMYLHARSLLNN